MIIHDTTGQHYHRKPAPPERGHVTTTTDGIELPGDRFAIVETEWRFKVWNDGPPEGVCATLVSRTPRVFNVSGPDGDLEMTDALRDEVLAAWEDKHEDADEREAEYKAIESY